MFPFKPIADLISFMSEIIISLFPINLFFTSAVCYEEINVGKTVFNFLEIEKNFVSVFKKGIGLQFFIFCISRSFFSMSLMEACLSEMLIDLCM